MTVHERIAGRRVVASISGGKDSAATSLFLREARHRAHARLRRYRLGASAHLRISALVRHKAIFPDRTKRFCTTMLKVEPILAFIDSLDDDVVNVIGVRREESKAREDAAEWENSKALDVEVWRPLVEWSLDDVKAIHARHGLSPNPLYGWGATRVGCWPCLHARQREIVLVADRDPERIARLRVLENEVTEDARARAAEKGEELDWIRTMFSIRESKKRPDAVTGIPRRHHRPMPIDEAVAWARAGVARGVREEPAPSCGEWGFCE